MSPGGDDWIRTSEYRSQNPVSYRLTTSLCYYCKNASSTHPSNAPIAIPKKNCHETVRVIIVVSLQAAQYSRDGGSSIGLPDA